MKNILVPSAFLAVAAGLLFAANVTTDYDHAADFSKYKTYTWLNARASDSLWQDRIVNAVDGQLTAKGWQKVDMSGDASVAAVGHTGHERTLETFYNGYPGWRWRGFGESTTRVQNIPVGTLTVDLFATSSKKLIWRAHGSDALSSKPEKNEKKLEKTVEDMFKKFPPNEKS